MAERAALKEALAQTREDLLEVARNLDRQAWSQPVYTHGDEASWSAGDLLRHLVWAEGGMLRMIQQLLEGGGGVPQEFDLDQYNAKGVAKLKSKMPADLLSLLAENRSQLLNLIDSLEAADWEKKGRHGSGQTMTVAGVVETIAAHEAQHTDDLRQALGALDG